MERPYNESASESAAAPQQESTSTISRYNQSLYLENMVTDEV